MLNRPSNFFQVMTDTLTEHQAWPRNNQDDISVYDKQWVQNNPHKTFIWLVYASGSHIIPVGAFDVIRYMFFRAQGLDVYSENATYWLCKGNVGTIEKINRDAVYTLIKESA